MTTPKPAPSVGIASARYARHLALTGFGSAGQGALAQARVLVVGAGGLGSPVIAYLAAAGVGTLGIVDDDAVELSNLQRQVIHGMQDVGLGKVASAARFVRELNPDVEVIQHDVRLDADSALRILPGYDVVVDGTDNFAARYLINDLCAALQLPLVWASLAEYEGQLGVVTPGSGPCYRCVFPQPPEPGAVLNCAEAGVLGVLPGILGSMQAAEVIKLIAGMGTPVAGVLMYDLLSATTQTLPVQRDEVCAACGDRAQELPGVLASRQSVREVSEREALTTEVVIDVREAAESVESPWPGAWQRPWSTWDEGGIQTLLHEVSDVPGGIVLVCASGVRSAAAGAMLLEAGMDHARVSSLRGGIVGLREGLGQEPSDA